MNKLAKSTVTVFTEERFVKDSAGSYFSPSGYNTEFWGRYLQVFSNVVIAARVQHQDAALEKAQCVEHDRISFFEIPYYEGVAQYIPKQLKIKKSIKEVCDASMHVVLRMPGQLSNLAVNYLVNTKKPYGVELVGDPSDVFGNGGAGGILSNYFASMFAKNTRMACENATAVAYVTKYILQKKYPASSRAMTTNYSSIVLEAKSIRTTPRNFIDKPQSSKLITVGSLAQMTKGVDVLLHSMVEIKKIIPNVTLEIVGDGACRAELESLAEKLGCESYVSFKGAVENKSIFNYLDQADVFVLATRGEGLPRVIIEAMARALPVVSTNVSGIPELLEPEYMVESGDSKGLALIVAGLLQNSQELNRLSEKNISVSQDFEKELMQSNRRAFYNALLADD